MPAEHEHDPLDRWLNQQVRPLPPPPGTFELISKRAKRRRMRKAVVSVAGAAAVAAAVSIAVPVGMSLHLNTSSSSANLAAGGSSTSPATSRQSPLTSGSTIAANPPAPSASASASAAAGTATTGPSAQGWLPANFRPSSVTWDSLSTGWIIGPAGTPGHCGARQDSAVCTSIAITHDGGVTWSGLPAPTTTDVSGLRFLNATYGWAFGPELWATDNGGTNWHQVKTGTSSVTDLETANGRAYALFGDCTQTHTDGDTEDSCTSYTLETAPVGSDAWTPVGGVPGNLSTAAGQQASAIIELDNASGYLVAPDGTLYSGPLDGSAWHKVAQLPCAPGPAKGDGQPQGLQVAPTGTTSASGATRLAMVCWQTSTGKTSVYQSIDNGSTWTEQTNVGSLPTTSVPESLTTLPDGTLILAAIPGSGGLGGGIYLLSPGATQWQQATVSDPSGTGFGFTYVGMTSAKQGVALGGNPDLHAIWMTTNGGKTWQTRPIQN